MQRIFSNRLSYRRQSWSGLFQTESVPFDICGIFKDPNHIILALRLRMRSKWAESPYVRVGGGGVPREWAPNVIGLRIYLTSEIQHIYAKSNSGTLHASTVYIFDSNARLSHGKAS